MQSQNNFNIILRSALTGTGVSILILLVGTLLDYLITQMLSQFFFAACSEECYFKIFNSIFILIIFLSIAGGAWAGVRSYKRLTE